MEISAVPPSLLKLDQQMDYVVGFKTWAHLRRSAAVAIFRFRSWESSAWIEPGLPIPTYHRSINSTTAAV